MDRQTPEEMRDNGGNREREWRERENGGREGERGRIGGEAS